MTDITKFYFIQFIQSEIDIAVFVYLYSLFLRELSAKIVNMKRLFVRI